MGPGGGRTVLRHAPKKRQRRLSFSIGACKRLGGRCVRVISSFVSAGAINEPGGGQVKLCGQGAGRRKGVRSTVTAARKSLIIGPTMTKGTIGMGNKGQNKLCSFGLFPERLLGLQGCRVLKDRPSFGQRHHPAPPHWTSWRFSNLCLAGWFKNATRH